MPGTDGRVITFEDDEGGQLNATWSKTGKRLIVTVGRRGERTQVQLTPEQVRTLGVFLAAQ
jgi:hypothetical protein